MRFPSPTRLETTRYFDAESSAAAAGGAAEEERRDLDTNRRDDDSSNDALQHYLGNGDGLVDENESGSDTDDEEEMAALARESAEARDELAAAEDELGMIARERRELMELLRQQQEQHAAVSLPSVDRGGGGRSGSFPQSSSGVAERSGGLEGGVPATSSDEESDSDSESMSDEVRQVKRQMQPRLVVRPHGVEVAPQAAGPRGDGRFGHHRGLDASNPVADSSEDDDEEVDGDELRAAEAQFESLKRERQSLRQLILAEASEAASSAPSSGSAGGVSRSKSYRGSPSHATVQHSALAVERERKAQWLRSQEGDAEVADTDVRARGAARERFAASERRVNRNVGHRAIKRGKRTKKLKKKKKTRKQARLSKRERAAEDVLRASLSPRMREQLSPVLQQMVATYAEESEDESDGSERAGPGNVSGAGEDDVTY